MIFSVDACKTKPTLAPKDLDTLSMHRIHHSSISEDSSTGFLGHSIMKSMKTCLFNERHGKYRSPNTLNSTTHFTIRLDRSSLCRVDLRGGLSKH